MMACAALWVFKMPWHGLSATDRRRRNKSIVRSRHGKRNWRWSVERLIEQEEGEDDMNRILLTTLICAALTATLPLLAVAQQPAAPIGPAKAAPKEELPVTAPVVARPDPAVETI